MNQNNSAVVESEFKPKPAGEKAARWRKLLEDQRISGLPVSVFCRERGIPQSSLFAWRRRLAVGEPAFKPVKVVSGRVDNSLGSGEEPVPRGLAGIELCLRGRRHLIVRRGFDRQLLLELVQAMESLT